MSKDAIKAIDSSKDYIKWGTIIALVIITAGSIPDIEIMSVSFTSFDSMATLLLGVGILFFFISIRLNFRERLDGEHIVTTIPSTQSPMSKATYGLFWLFLILFIIRIIILTIRGF